MKDHEQRTIWDDIARSLPKSGAPVEVKRVGTRVVVRSPDLLTAIEVEKAIKFWVINGK